MKNLQKVLCLVLAMVMMLSVMIVGAGAVKTFPDQKDIVNTEAVNMNVALNIIKGRDTGEFDPTGNVTRAEMAKMICVLWNGGEEPQLGTKTEATYTDISGHWAEAYIEYCSALGIVAGMGDNTFDPNASVTGTQAAKMLLVALGYNAEVEDFNGLSWAVKINVRANEKSLYADLPSSFDPNSTLNRDNASQMVWNALQAYMVTYTNEFTTVNGQLVATQKLADKTNSNNQRVSLLFDKYGAIDYEYGQLERFDYNSDKEEWTYYFTTGANMSHPSFTTSTDFTSLYGQTVKVIYDEKSNGDVDTVYGMFAKDGKVLVSGLMGDMNAVKATDDKITIDGTSYKLETASSSITAQVYQFAYNTDINDTVTAGDVFARFDLDGDVTADTIVDLTANTAEGHSVNGFKFDAIDDDDDGKIDFFMVYPFEVGQVTYAGAKNFTVQNNQSYPVLNTTFKFEDVVAYDGLAEDDFVVYTHAKNTTTNDGTFTKVDTIVKGNITATKGSYQFAVDGTWYEGVFTTAAPTASTAGLNVSDGGSVADVAVVNGYVFMADSSGLKDVSDYAVVIGTDAGAYSNTAKLLFSDGTKKVVDTDKDYDTSGPNQIAAGTMVTFTTNGDGEYILDDVATAASGTEAVGSGFDVYYNAFVAGDRNSTNNKVKYIGGADIDDDAVIFVQTGGSTYKTISGARLKSTDGSAMTVVHAYADKNSTTGYETIQVAYVTNTTAISSADITYGYLVSNPSLIENDSKTKVMGLEILGEDSKIINLNTADRTTQLEDNTGTGIAGKDFTDLAEGMVIGYTTDNDGDVDSVRVYGTTGLGTTADPLKLTRAITSISSDGKYVSFDGSSTRYEITNDTIVIVIDAEGPRAGDGAVSKAYKDNTGAWVNNVIVDLDGTDMEVDMIVIDYQNDIDDVES